MAIKAKWYLIICSLLFITSAHAETDLAILTDKSTIDNDDIVLFAARQIADVSGVSYIITTSMEEAASCRLILPAFSDESAPIEGERADRMLAYVQQGGCLVLWGNNFSSSFAQKAGSGWTIKNDSIFQHFLWKTGYNSANELNWINDSTQQDVLINKNLTDEILFKTYYALPQPGASFTPLAQYERGSIASFRQNIEKGALYFIGIKLRDLGRTLINLKEGTRVKPNCYDGATEGFLLLARGICESRLPLMVVKHTSPAATRGVLVITHDVDCKTSLDTMQYYSQYEQSLGYKAHYFVTTSTTKDSRGFGFYTADRLPQLQYLIACGHTIGSHSVSHLLDMDYKVPVGKQGEYDRESYHATYDGKTSHNATIFAELEVSRDILEEDLGKSIRSFRAGHLSISTSLPMVMDDLHYNLSSNLLSRHIHTSYPFLQRRFLKTAALSTDSLIEIPLSISDVESYEDDSTFNKEVLEHWKSYIHHSIGNYTPNVLLIHPNRRYKLQMEKELVEGMPAGMGLYNLTDLRDYWYSRYKLNFTTLEDSLRNVVLIRLSQPFDSVNCDISFLVRGAQGRDIIFTDSQGREKKAIVTPFDNSYVVCLMGGESRVVYNRTPRHIEQGARDEKPCEPLFKTSQDNKSCSFTGDGGSGSIKDPLLVSTAASLKALAQAVNEGASMKGLFFMLTQDIDLTPLCNSSKGNWEPIGNGYERRFCGCFDGGGHTIKHLYINNDTLACAALFGFIDSAQILNLHIDSSEVTGGSRVSLLCARAYRSSLIKGCTVRGNLQGNSFTGGLCGDLSYGSVIENCSMWGSVSGGKNALYTGGICGYAALGSRLSNISHAGSTSGYDYTGGICGYCYASSMSEATESSSIEGCRRMGGLCGEALLSNLSNAALGCHVYGNKKSAALVGAVFGQLIQSTSADILSWSTMSHAGATGFLGEYAGGCLNSIASHSFYDKQMVWNRTMELTGTCDNSSLDLTGLLTAQWLSQDEFPALLKGGKWIQFSQSYPQIAAQKEESISRLTAVPLVLAAESENSYENLSAIESNFSIRLPYGATVIDTKKRLDLAGEEIGILTYGNDTLQLSLGGITRSLYLKTVKPTSVELVTTNPGKCTVTTGQGYLTITGAEPIAKARIFNGSGMELSCATGNNTTLSLPIESPASLTGKLYILLIQYRSGRSEQCKLML